MVVGGDKLLGMGDLGMEDGSLRSVLCIFFEVSGVVFGGLVFGFIRFDAFLFLDIHMV